MYAYAQFTIHNHKTSPDRKFQRLPFKMTPNGAEKCTPLPTLWTSDSEIIWGLRSSTRNLRPILRLVDGMVTSFRAELSPIIQVGESDFLASGEAYINNILTWNGKWQSRLSPNLLFLVCVFIHLSYALHLNYHMLCFSLLHQGVKSSRFNSGLTSLCSGMFLFQLPIVTFHMRQFLTVHINLQGYMAMANRKTGPFGWVSALMTFPTWSL